MIIVSQDKDLIVNFSNLTAIGLTEGDTKEIASITTNGEEQSLGRYSTEKRAKEVLKEIQRVYYALTVLPFVKLEKNERQRPGKINIL